MQVVICVKESELESVSWKAEGCLRNLTNNVNKFASVYLAGVTVVAHG